MKDAPRRGVAYMLFAATSFAVMNALVSVLGRAGVPWTTTAFARAFVGVLVALFVARVRRAPLHVKDRRTMWIRTIAGTSSMLCTFFALSRLPLGDATALLNTTPLWIAIVAWYTLGEKPGKFVLIALFIAAVGVVFVEQPAWQIGNIAGFFALLAGALSAFAMVSLRRLSGETPEAVVVYFSAFASMVLALLMGAHSVHTGRGPYREGWWWVLILVGVTATIGQLAMTRAYALDRAARVGATGWVQIVMVVLVDGVFLHRWPAGGARLGIGILMGAGVLLVWDARRSQIEQENSRASVLVEEAESKS